MKAAKAAARNGGTRISLMHLRLGECRASAGSRGAHHRSADADHPRPRVGPEHRADLGDEERVTAEDRPARLDELLGGLRVADVPHDPGIGSLVVALPRVIDQPRYRTRPGPDLRTGSIPSPKVRIGLIFRVDPIAARAAPIRPPAAGTRACRARTRCPRRRAPARPGRRLLGAGAAAGAIIAASSTIPVPPAALRLSTVWIRSPPFPSSVSRSIACFGGLGVPEIPAEMCTETISRPSASSGS